MEPRELIYNVYKDITSIKTKFDDERTFGATHIKQSRD